MNTFNEAFHPKNSHRAPDGFADKVMWRIQSEQIGFQNSFSLGRRIAGIAAMFIMCVSLGIAIGSNARPGFLLGIGKSSIQEFQDMHHLSGTHDASLFPLFQEDRGWKIEDGR